MQQTNREAARDAFFAAIEQNRKYELVFSAELKGHLEALAKIARAAAFAAPISQEIVEFQRIWSQTLRLAIAENHHLSGDLRTAYDRWAEVPKLRKRRWALPEQNIAKFSLFVRYLLKHAVGIERTYLFVAARDRKIDAYGRTNGEIHELVSDYDIRQGVKAASTEAA